MAWPRVELQFHALWMLALAASVSAFGASPSRALALGAARRGPSFRGRMTEFSNERTPLSIDIAPAGVKGMGAFAAEPTSKGEWVCSYEGELLTLDEVLVRYAHEDPAYLFSLGDGAGLYLDGARGTHPSRYINHHQNGTLVPKVSLEERRVDFYAARDILPGEELTFDCASPLSLRAVTISDASRRTQQLRCWCTLLPCPQYILMMCASPLLLSCRWRGLLARFTTFAIVR
mmetsp:Transcript_19770/g.59984  ORF Transcript_19770/g.59984 Transcript_19770/m.59984 type:complete len:232 (-) Transcript_19770:516-1211(-)